MVARTDSFSPDAHDEVDFELVHIPADVVARSTVSRMGVQVNRSGSGDIVPTLRLHVGQHHVLVYDICCIGVTRLRQSYNPHRPLEQNAWMEYRGEVTAQLELDGDWVAIDDIPEGMWAKTAGRC
jgi:hypothetical protein